MYRKKKRKKKRKSGPSYNKLVKYASRELGVTPVSLVSPEMELAPLVAEQMGLPVPREPRQRWEVLHAFYVADPKHRRRVHAPQPSDRPLPDVTSSAFLASYEWRRVRMEVIQERGARCECCGASPRDGRTVINVDHVKPRRTYPHLALSKDNMQVLCSVCNHGKGNWSEHDWRT